MNTRRRAANPEKTALTLAKICAAARQVFYEKGFHDSAVEEIAQRAEVSRATVYLYFRGKDDILLTILRDDLAHQMGEYEKLALIEVVSKAALISWLGDYRRLMDERRGSLNLFRVSFNLVPELMLSTAQHRETAIAKLGARFAGFDLDALDRAARNVQRVKCYMMLFLIEEAAVNFSDAPAAPTLDLGFDVLADVLLYFLSAGELRTEVGDCRQG